MTDKEQRAHDLTLVYLSQKLTDGNQITSESRIQAIVQDYESAYKKVLELLH